MSWLPDFSELVSSLQATGRARNAEQGKPRDVLAPGLWVFGTIAPSEILLPTDVASNGFASWPPPQLEDIGKSLVIMPDGSFDWAMVSGGATPSGPAGGDLTGFYPDPLIRDGVVTGAKLSPAPGVDDTGKVLTATGVGTFAWQDPAATGEWLDTTTRLEPKKGTTYPFRAGSSTFLPTANVSAEINLYRPALPPLGDPIAGILFTSGPEDPDADVGGSLLLYATQDWTASAHGSMLVMRVVRNNTTTLLDHTILRENGQLVLPAASAAIRMGDTAFARERLDIQGACILGNAASVNPGTVQYAGGRFQGRNETGWVNLDEPAPGATLWVDEPGPQMLVPVGNNYGVAIQPGGDGFVIRHSNYPTIDRRTGIDADDNLLQVSGGSSGIFFRSFDASVPFGMVSGSGKWRFAPDTTFATERLEVAGGVQVGTALAAQVGTIQYVGGRFQGRNATAWVNLDEAAGGPSHWTDDGTFLSPDPTARGIKLDSDWGIQWGAAARPFVKGYVDGMLRLSVPAGGSFDFDFNGAGGAALWPDFFEVKCVQLAMDERATPTDGTIHYDPFTTHFQGYKSGAWVNLDEAGGGGIPEAPTDGQLYGRQSADWAVVPSGGSAQWSLATNVFTPIDAGAWVLQVKTPGDDSATAGATVRISTFTNQASAREPKLDFRRARVGPAAAAVNNILANIQVNPAISASQYASCSEMKWVATENQSATNKGCDWELSLSPTGQSALSSKLTFKNDGSLTATGTRMEMTRVRLDQGATGLEISSNLFGAPSNTFAQPSWRIRFDHVNDKFEVRRRAGSAGAESTPFTITSDGRATVLLDPTAALDVATKQYVDGKTFSSTAGGDLSGTYPNPTVAKASVSPFVIGTGARKTRVQGGGSIGSISFSASQSGAAVDDAAAPSWMLYLSGGTTAATDKFSVFRAPPGAVANWTEFLTLDAAGKLTLPGPTTAETTDQAAIKCGQRTAKGRIQSLPGLDWFGLVYNGRYTGTNWAADDSAQPVWQLNLGAGDGLWLSRALGTTPDVASTMLAMDNTGTLTVNSVKALGGYWVGPSTGTHGLLAYNADQTMLLQNDFWNPQDINKSSWLVHLQGDASNRFVVSYRAPGQPGGTQSHYLLFDNGGSLTISGAFGVKSTGTTWSNPSDERIKKNIQPFTPSLDLLAQLVPRRFQFNGEGGTTDGLDGIGFIAQEVLPIMPEMVTTKRGTIAGQDTDIYQLDQTALTLMLLNAVKELAGRVAALESA